MNDLNFKEIISSKDAGRILDKNECEMDCMAIKDKSIISNFIDGKIWFLKEKIMQLKKIL